jgi:hypothetical protein
MSKAILAASVMVLAVLFGACNDVGDCPTAITPGGSCSGDSLACPFTLTSSDLTTTCPTSCTCTSGQWACPPAEACQAPVLSGDDGGGQGDDGATGDDGTVDNGEGAATEEGSAGEAGGG